MTARRPSFHIDTPIIFEMEDALANKRRRNTVNVVRESNRSECRLDQLVQQL